MEEMKNHWPGHGLSADVLDKTFLADIILSIWFLLSVFSIQRYRTFSLTWLLYFLINRTFSRASRNENGFCNKLANLRFKCKAQRGSTPRLTSFCLFFVYYGANKERLRSAWKSETGITSFSLTHPRDGIATKRKSISVTEVQIHSWWRCSW